MPTHRRTVTRRSLFGGVLTSMGVGLLAACGGGAAATSTIATLAPKAAGSTAAVAGAQTTLATTAAASSSSAPAQSATPSATTAGAVATAPASTASHARTSVTYLIYAGAQEKTAWEATKAAFEQNNPDLALDMTYTGANEDYGTKLSTLLASGSAPDTARVAPRSPLPPNQLLPLDTYIAQDKTSNFADYMPGVLDTGKYQGKTLVLMGKLGPQVLFYNGRIFKDRGLALPNDLADKGQWTFDSFTSACAKLTITTGSTPKQFAYVPYVPFWSWIHQAGGAPFNADYTQDQFDQAQNYEPLQVAADLVNQHHWGPGAQDPKQFQSWPGFASGLAAMFISGPWQMARIYGRLTDEWDIAPPPIQPNGKPVMQTGGEAVLAASKRPAEAFRWVAFMEGQAGQTIWSHLGTDLPARRSVLTDFAAGKLFKDPKMAPPHNRLWMDIIPQCTTLDSGWLTNDANKVYNDAWSSVSANKATAKDAFTQAHQLAAQYLKLS